MSASVTAPKRKGKSTKNGVETQVVTLPSTTLTPRTMADVAAAVEKIVEGRPSKKKPAAKKKPATKNPYDPDSIAWSRIGQDPYWKRRQSGYVAPPKKWLGQLLGAPIKNLSPTVLAWAPRGTDALAHVADRHRSHLCVDDGVGELTRRHLLVQPVG